eukprot:CAMPEP_0198131020 /NCGR_PEP_ID=MMETSP1442-20131203/55191_1 /TAXON_ID= /ORGANISM="Craspedostauros australis, Strain CCMP3328" /LENGTH=84 /DNA_ID=CAMNT_0043791747 /DNA_START=197 /DNA_END=448 /DNA_ORIENTATION=-
MTARSPMRLYRQDDAVVLVHDKTSTQATALQSLFFATSIVLALYPVACAALMWYRDEFRDSTIMHDRLQSTMILDASAVVVLDW